MVYIDAMSLSKTPFFGLKAADMPPLYILDAHSASLGRCIGFAIVITTFWKQDFNR